MSQASSQPGSLLPKRVHPALLPRLRTGEECAAMLRKRGVRVLRTYHAAAVPRLSVIIPMFNTARWIGAALNSALEQTQAEIEVVLVDDGSTDDGLARALAFTDARLTVLTQPNQGLSAARNSGILAARAALLGFLDGDDVWFPNKVERHLEVLAHQPETGVTFDWSAYLDEKGTQTGQFLINRCASPDARALARRNHVGNGSSAVVRRECFALAGLFDESLRSCEDLDMWIRIAAHTPLSLQLISEVLTGYRVREGSLSVRFETFVLAAETLSARLASNTPGLGAEDGRRCLAQLLRITSRKALADGQVVLARRLLWRALRSHPVTVLSDVRGLVLLAILVGTRWLPEAMTYRLYGLTAQGTGSMTAQLLQRKDRLPAAVTP